MAQLKPGGLALVYGLKQDVEWNGKMVTLVEPHIDPSNNSFWYIAEDDDLFAEKNLLPIDPDDEKKIEQYHQFDAGRPQEVTPGVV